MLEARLKEYKSRSRLVPRNRELLELERWYTLSSNDPEFLRYQKSGSKLSFSRWLLKARGLDTNEVARLCKKVAESEIQVKVSCRFNDIFRMADTPHFKSCCAPGLLGDRTPSKIAQDPTAAIIYTPDKAGKFKGRAIFTLRSGEIKILRCYGVFKFDLLKPFFESLGFRVNPSTDDTVIYFSESRRL